MATALPPLAGAGTAGSRQRDTAHGAATRGPRWRPPGAAGHGGGGERGGEEEEDGDEEGAGAEGAPGPRGAARGGSGGPVGVPPGGLGASSPAWGAWRGRCASGPFGTLGSVYGQAPAAWCFK